MAAPKLGILGQSAPAAGTTTTVYTVPAARQAVLSTIVAATTSSTATTVRVHVSTGGAAAVGNAIAYDVALSGNSHMAITEGITLEAADIVAVQSAGGNVTFTIFGEETDVPSA